jgi:hypothetical protein
MTDVLEALTRDHAIERNLGPDGRTWGITRKTRNNLVEIIPVDGPECRVLPDGLRGQFTKEMLAEAAITKFLTEMWNMSEATKQRSESLKRTAKTVKEE